MSEQTGGKAIVHIIDDDASLRRAVESLCGSVGLETRTYGSGQEFLDAKRENIAGCLVLDVRLPGMKGLDFQSQMAAFGIQFPIILVRANVRRDRFSTLSPREQQVMMLVTRQDEQEGGRQPGLERDNGEDSSRRSNAEKGRARMADALKPKSP
jgi:CheY-like chemotaxis protein